MYRAPKLLLAVLSLGFAIAQFVVYGNNTVCRSAAHHPKCHRPCCVSLISGFLMACAMGFIVSFLLLLLLFSLFALNVVVQLNARI